MTVIAFDTLAYSNKLKQGGMEAKLADIQAEETAKILSDLATNQLATKQDLNTLKSDLLKEIHLNTWKIIGLIAGLQALFHFIK
jgi:hypothetical protein